MTGTTARPMNKDSTDAFLLVPTDHEKKMIGKSVAFGNDITYALISFHYENLPMHNIEIFFICRN